MENNLWKILVGAGIMLIIAGVLVYFLGKPEGGFLGKLPGDILIKRKNFTFHFPIVTSILLSIVLSLLLYLARKFF
jgi:hypothetical protein